MTFAEAIAAIHAGRAVRNAQGSVFWLTTDKRGPVLRLKSTRGGVELSHAVFSSEHFRDNQDWQLVTEESA